MRKIPVRGAGFLDVPSPPLFWELAQLVEPVAVNHVVVGSIPTLPAILNGKSNIEAGHKGKSSPTRPS